VELRPGLQKLDPTLLQLGSQIGMFSQTRLICRDEVRAGALAALKRVGTEDISIKRLLPELQSRLQVHEFIKDIVNATQT